MRIVEANEAAAGIVTDTTNIGVVEMTKGGLIGDIDLVHMTETGITSKDQGQETLTGGGTASVSTDRRGIAATRLRQDDDRGRDREKETTTGGNEILEQGDSQRSLPQACVIMGMIGLNHRTLISLRTSGDDHKRHSTELIYRKESSSRRKTAFLQTGSEKKKRQEENNTPCES